MSRKKKILVAPLDWGIGHATRCIPIINKLVEKGFEILIAGEGRSLSLLKHEFPNIETVYLKGYNIEYSAKDKMNMTIISQIPKILYYIKKEHTQIKKIIKEYKIDGIISDSRFGLWSEKIPSVFITHQLEIQSKILQSKIQKINYKYINKFDVCWILDHENNGLAGRLSHPEYLPKNIIYIGPLSRFKNQKEQIKYELLALISGPEPQRSILEDILKKQIIEYNQPALIVLGKPDISIEEKIKNVEIKSHLNATELNKAILQSNIIICRSGYSSVMDLAKLNKKVIFIPTKGQTEQEYLANYFQEQGICNYTKQAEFNLTESLEKNKTYSGFNNYLNKKINWGDLFSLFLK
ncbi:MAG: glycosyltransferase family protein [Bacteroidota bacterium]|nr:glycosyltransferase family protein [Bacteroidota bacterium]